MPGELLPGIAVSHLANAAAAGTTAVNGSAVDQQGFSGVTFIADLGALTATQVTQLKAQWSDTNNGADWADFTSPSGGAITAAAADADSNKCLVLDIFAPMHRYLRPVLLRGTANAVLNAIVALQYAARSKPTTQPATVSQSAAFAQPS